jgi:hypothetical protein
VRGNGRRLAALCALACAGLCAVGSLAIPTGAQPAGGSHRTAPPGVSVLAPTTSPTSTTTSTSTSTTTTTTSTTTTTTTTTTPTTTIALPALSFVQPTAPDELPPAGEATGFGCAAAAQYIAAYAAPGFWLACPAYSRGHQASTVCESTTSPCSVLRIITITDPCAAAYMNEASNSWVLMGLSDAPLDPYGMCS